MNKKILIIICLIAIIIIAGIICVVVNKNTKENNSNEIKTENTIKKETKNKDNSNEIESKNEISTQNETKNKEEESDNNMYSKGKHHASIEIKNYGTIDLELDADTAPITVANFAKLVNEGFYNGLTFHRIIDGFMIQGGDPKGDGTGGSDKTIKGEFKENGVENKISHKRGVISMARSSMFDSASSQFFIVHKDSDFLDGQYAGFGKVTKGIEIVDKICNDTKVEDTNGTVLKANQPIIEKIVMKD